MCCRQIGTPIEQVAITVRLPKPVDADSIEVYAGRYGSETLDGDVSWDYDEASRTIEITGRDLSQGEGITILCDLPEGYDVRTYSLFQGTPTRVLRDGDGSADARALAVVRERSASGADGGILSSAEHDAGGGRLCTGWRRR